MTTEYKGIITMFLKWLLRKSRNVFKTLPNKERLYEEAQLMLGEDASPLDFVTDELGCAESVSNIISKVIDFKIVTGTWSLNRILKNDPRFNRVTTGPERGSIIISPTGTGNGKIRGHVGILGMGGSIMSADSRTGLWTKFYTLESWDERYKIKGGFPIYFYELM